MENLQEIWNNYKGAIIGILIAVVIWFTKLYNLILVLILIALCAFLGNYIQKNKEDVKTKIKDIIDRF